MLGLIHTIKGFEIAASQAAISGEFNDALLAMNLTPLVLSDKDAEVLTREMLLAHKAHLPNFAHAIAQLAASN